MVTNGSAAVRVGLSPSSDPNILKVGEVRAVVAMVSIAGSRFLAGITFLDSRDPTLQPPDTSSSLVVMVDALSHGFLGGGSEQRAVHASELDGSAQRASTEKLVIQSVQENIGSGEGCDNDVATPTIMLTPDTEAGGLRFAVGGTTIGFS